MSTIDAHNTLRRTRSTGDIPRRPEPTHRPYSRHSNSRSEIRDLHVGHGTPPATHTPRSVGMVPGGRWSPPLAISLHPEIPPTTTLWAPVVQSEPSQETNRRQHNRSFISRTLTFFGFGREGSRDRRSFIGLWTGLTSGLVQIVVITTVLALSGTRFKSPTQPNLTEWVACNRPLGIWACIWMVRAILASVLSYWGFIRERQNHQHHAEAGPSNPSTGLGTVATEAPTIVGGVSQPYASGSSDTPNGESRERTPLPYTRLYSRLTLLSSLLTLSWFLTAHILEYTSINTCRLSSPHIWWLTFAILCILYIMILEVVLLGLVVFIIAPVLFLFWNIFLVCIGRHPIQTGNAIKPEIGKLSKSIVDRIPLVMYIPPPPEGPPAETIVFPKPTHSYPPKSSITTSSPKTRFRYIKNLTSIKGRRNEKGASPSTDSSDEKNTEKSAEPPTWEEHWESGDYPFVVLEGNRAACAICLMDFEEPKRVLDLPPDKTEAKIPLPINVSSSEVSPLDHSDIGAGASSVRIEEEDRAEELKLADAGEGAQPLRLLTCGHVFHKTCLDPWLTDVSGRCPVCQRAVEMPEPKKSRKERLLNR